MPGRTNDVAASTPSEAAVGATGLFFHTLLGSPEFADFALILKRLTGLSMALNTPDVATSRTGVSGDGGNPLCRIIPDTHDGAQRRESCDRRHHTLAGAEGKAHAYKCHAGFIDMAIPVMIQGTHVATISSGQILPERPSAAAPEPTPAITAGNAAWRRKRDSIQRTGGHAASTTTA